MIEIQKFTFNPFAENTFIIWNTNTLEAAVIDPGCLERQEENQLTEFFETKNLNLKYLINTHCHIDHIFGLSFIKNNFAVDYYAPEKDLPLLRNAKMQADMFGIDFNQPPEPDFLIKDEIELMLGNSVMKFLFTPGHTPGEFCINFPEEKFCITGDVLFRESIGRTDLWGGNQKILMNSINTKLLTLDDETIIYPGHGDNSTIGYEKENNPFLTGVF